MMASNEVSASGDAPGLPDEAQRAAAAFLARYSDRTLEAYRHDLRYFLQWATDQHLDVLGVTRARIEIYRSTMDQRGLAASTIDRRLSTVCGYYRFADIDGRIAANPAQYVRRPKVQPAEQQQSTALSSAASCSPPSTTTAPTPHSQCCWARRAQSLGGVRHECRGSRLRARASHAADRRQGQQARRHPAGATHRTNNDAVYDPAMTDLEVDA